ncbi:MAG: Rrf2 family transcriptional regulator [Verrucomicrobia bacterium]|nr:Rrf2 family transcriptional regulator [Verrucomicrobiota bacterium]
MFIYGKTATNAIAVMSYLAAEAPHRVGSAAIAKARNISRVSTAKLLTQLSGAGFLSGQPGPGGGYTLARSAAAIRLIEIVLVFEQLDERSPCPFGANWCGHKLPCPLHDSIAGMVARNRRFLEQTRLSVFQRKAGSAKPPKPRAKTAAKKTRPIPKSRRSGNPSK